MDVGLDPELTKWSVRSGPAIVLTGKGYKEHHWLVIPHQPLRLLPSHHHYHSISSCLCPLAPFRELRMSLVEDAPLFVSAVRLEIEPTLGGPLLPLCSTRRVIV